MLPQLSPEPVLLHKKRRKLVRSCRSLSEPPQCLTGDVAVADVSGSECLPRLAIARDCRRAPARDWALDWHSSAPLHWGLPNGALGYNETTKMRFDRALERQRRNFRLMKSFATVDETVSALLQLLQMETAAVLVQTPDRAHTRGDVFTMKNFVNHALGLDEKLARAAKLTILFFCVFPF